MSTHVSPIPTYQVYKQHISQHDLCTGASPLNLVDSRTDEICMFTDMCGHIWTRGRTRAHTRRRSRSCGTMCAGKTLWASLTRGWTSSARPFMRWRAFFSIPSEHADGERRGPVSICRCLKTRLTEIFPTLPSDPIQPLGVRRRRAPIVAENRSVVQRDPRRGRGEVFVARQ